MMAGWTSATMVLSRANRKVVDRIDTTVKTHTKPWMSRGAFNVSGGSAAFSADAVSLARPDAGVRVPGI